MAQDGADDARKTNHVIKGSGLWAMWYQPHQWGRGLDIEPGGWWFAQSYIVKCQSKFWTWELGQASLVVSPPCTRARCSLRTQTLPLGTSWPHPVYLFFWLVLTCILILYKTAILRKALSRVLWVTLQKYQTREGSGNPLIYSQLIRNAGARGPGFAVSKVRVVLRRTVPWTVKSNSR